MHACMLDVHEARPSDAMLLRCLRRARLGIPAASMPACQHLFSIGLLCRKCTLRCPPSEPPGAHSFSNARQQSSPVTSVTGTPGRLDHDVRSSRQPVLAAQDSARDSRFWLTLWPLRRRAASAALTNCTLWRSQREKLLLDSVKMTSEVRADTARYSGSVLAPKDAAGRSCTARRSLGRAGERALSADSEARKEAAAGAPPVLQAASAAAAVPAASAAPAGAPESALTRASAARPYLCRSFQPVATHVVREAGQRRRRKQRHEDAAA